MKSGNSGEFDLIAKYFKPLAGEGPPAFGLTDDAAVLSPPEGMDLVFTKDALVADVHFFAADPPDLIAQKAVRVNLSDLAAMGAAPMGYLLALAIPTSWENSDDWVAAFSAGLKKDQDEFGWSLYGGDTVSTSGPLMISITAIGSVKRGEALRRNGAMPLDDIYVSGTLGDAAMGLICLKNNISAPYNDLINRYHVPRPRLELGQNLGGVASSVMDISDGLSGDIRHICDVSGLGAEIQADLIPLSVAAGNFLERFPLYKNVIWNGGDDYELLFTAPSHKSQKIEKLSESLGLCLTKIGHMTEEKRVVILDEHGINIASDDQGFRHF